MSSPKLSEEFKRDDIRKIDCSKLKYEKEAEFEIYKRKLNDFTNCEKNNYVTKNLTLFELLKELKKNNEINHIEDFINLFAPNNSKATRRHVFEALWIIIYVLQLDNIYSSNNTRTIYKTLEKYGNSDNYEIESCDDKSNVFKFLKNSKVNVSRKGGIVDLFFSDKLKKEKIHEIKDGYACNNECKKNKTSEIFYGYSSKYRDDDKRSGIGSLDIDNIYTEYIKHPEFKNKFKIGIFVKNKERYFTTNTHKRAKQLLSNDISYDLEDLNIIYKRKLKKWLENTNLNENVILPEIGNMLTPRLHQEYFIQYTNNNINDSDKKLFVWGAVPRSGKSYMIGGLIEKRKPDIALVILGAVGETNQQFVNMFSEYKSSFGEYNIKDVQKLKLSEKELLFNKDKLTPGEKLIIVVSQQQLWQTEKDEIQEDKNQKRKQKIHPNFQKLLRETENKLVFFDEIHQGATIDGAKIETSAQKQILTNYILNENGSLNTPFIMVTATFLKPVIAYRSLLPNNEEPVIIQWTYDMMQQMKYISNPEEKENMLAMFNKQEDSNKKQLFKQLLDEYKEKFDTLETLEEQYKKEPKLTIISPDIKLTNDYKKLRHDQNGDVNILDIFNLDKLNHPNPDIQGLEELCKYIVDIYKKLAEDYNYNVYTKRHSQLWFLPTIEETRDQSSKSNEENLGRVEPYMRFLLKALLKNEEISERFCIFLLHGGKNKIQKNEIKYQDIKKKYINSTSLDILKVDVDNSLENSNNKVCFTFKMVDDKGNWKEQMRQEECKAYAKGKSVIILTGNMARLGVSLPCVDIALHMDPIHSVDTIYQSMFRVLTASKKKTDGYFIDLLKHRCIQFMYDYESNLNFNKGGTTEEKRKRIQNLLYSHNFNGIQLKTEMEMLDNINELYKEFKIDSDENFREQQKEFNLITKNREELLNSVIEIFDKKDIEKFSLILAGLSYVNASGKSKKITTTKRMDIKKKTKEQKNKNDKNKDLDYQEQLQITKFYFQKILELLALFDDTSSKCNFSTIKNKIDNLRESKDKIRKEELQIKNDDNSEKIKNNLRKELLIKLCQEPDKIVECYLSRSFKGIKVDNKDISNDAIIKKIQGVIEIIYERFEIIKTKYKNKQEEIETLYCDIVKDMTKIKEYHTTNLNNKACSDSFIKDEKILNMIKSRLSVRKSEKEEFGEVFTPVELVCEMLDTLPQEVWSNDKLKWLDPANGIGNYPVVVYYKLMEGLKDKIKDEKERSKHIIEDMLYMVELNPVNVKMCKKIFKMIDSNATPNIYNSPFYTDEESNLKETWTNKCSVKKFDIIIGNPPYNQGGVKSKKGSKEGKKTIWPLFIENSLNILTNNGYLLFITPNTWTELVSDTSKKILNIQIEVLKCYNYKKSKQLFGNESGKIPLSFYLFKNTLSKNDTLIWDDNHKKYINFNIYKNNFIPNFNVSIFKKVLQKSKDNNLSKFYVGGQTKKKELYQPKYSSTFKYPLLNYANHKSNVFFSKICFRGNNNIKKLVLPNFSMGYPILDEYGIIDTKSENLYMIFNKSLSILELKKLQLLLLSPITLLLINSLKTKQNFLSHRIFKILPDVSKMDFEINDENLYKYYKFNDKDKEAVKNQVEHGEGNLTPEQKKDILNFNIKKYLTESQIQDIKDSIEKECKSPKNKTRKREKPIKTPKCSDAHPPPPCPPGQYAKKQKGGIECCYKDTSKKQTKTKPKSPPKGGKKTRRKIIYKPKSHKNKQTHKKKHVKKPKLTRKRNKSKGFFSRFFSN